MRLRIAGEREEKTASLRLVKSGDGDVCLMVDTSSRTWKVVRLYLKGGVLCIEGPTADGSKIVGTIELE